VAKLIYSMLMWLTATRRTGGASAGALVQLRLRADPRARVFKAEKLVAVVRIEYPAPTRDGD